MKTLKKRKRRGYVLSTCLAAMTVVMVFTSLIALLLTLDNDSLKRKGNSLTETLDEYFSTEE